MLHQLKSFFYRIRLSEFAHKLITERHRKNYNKTHVRFKNEFVEKISKMVSEDGYAITSLDEIFKETSEKPFQLSQFQKILENMNNCHLIGNHQLTRKKNFLYRYSEIDNQLNFEDPLVQMSVFGIFHQIGRSYFKQNVRLTNIDYWLNFPVEKNDKEISSQKWHRDYEDLNVFKVFVYMTDVDFSNGCLSYVSKSNCGNLHGKKFLRAPPLGVVVEDGVIRNSFQSAEIVDFCVQKGTVVFVDTSGLHKGGYCKSLNRFLFTSTYTTFAGISPRNYKIPKNWVNGFSGEKYIIDSLIN